jgi:hypothetical protein
MHCPELDKDVESPQIGFLEAGIWLFLQALDLA